MQVGDVVQTEMDTGYILVGVLPGRKARPCVGISAPIFPACLFARSPSVFSSRLFAGHPRGLPFRFKKDSSLLLQLLLLLLLLSVFFQSPSSRCRSLLVIT